MFSIDMRIRTPIYEQIKEQVMQYIQLGVLKPNDKLPSIRSLAQELHLNVNTVNRAFSELEKSGVIYSMPGLGNFVNYDAFSNAKIKTDAINELQTSMRSAKIRGVTEEEMGNIVKEIYKG